MVYRAIRIVLAVLAAVPTAAIDKQLEKAIKDNNPSMVKLALKSGARINEIGDGGQTPLMSAVLQGKHKAVQALLKGGADVSIPEKDGYTPMHGAAFQGRDRVAQILITHGLDPSSMHADGYTPLHRACWGDTPGHVETVRVFMNAGVAWDEPTADGKTPVEITNNKQIKKILEDYKGKTMPKREVKKEL